MDQSRFIRGLLDDPADPQQPQYVPANDFGPRAYGLLNTLFPDPYEAVGDAVRQYRGGDAVGAFETMFGAIPATGALKAAPKAAGIIAYHGSPHSFDRFDMSKIGTGEGAQAYGHGLYFAENEGVARQYRDNLSGRNSPISKAVFKEGKEIPWYEVSADDRKLLPILSDAGGDVKKAKELVVNGFLPSAHNRLFSELDRIASEGYELRPHGSMYEVRINADPEHFLDWDKPLNEQSPIVRRAVLENTPQYQIKHIGGIPHMFAGNKMIEVESPELSGRDAYILSRMGRDIDNTRDAASSASQSLKEAGIPGIKYLDGGSRAAGDGSRNYVVFDDSLIAILKKYGLVGLLGGGAAASGVSGMNAPPAVPNSAPGL